MSETPSPPSPPPPPPPEDPGSPAAVATPAPVAAGGGFWRSTGGFLAGCLSTLVFGAVIFLALFQSGKPMGCAVVQLVYVIPAVFFLFRRGRRSVALGFIFGGALVFLLASMCGGFTNMH